MTLSNFDWTDKNSVKWFILLPGGHEGPYSLGDLIQKKDKNKISPDVKVWAEGLTDAVTLKEVLAHDTPEIKTHVEEQPPELLPPLPEEEIPPLPAEESVPEMTVEENRPVKKKNSLAIAAGIGVVLVAGAGLVLYSFVKSKETFDIRRLPKMSLDIQERIIKENSFSGWDKPIFFREYLPQDHSSIWLVTSSFHECKVDGIFTSLDDKLLSMQDEKVSFRSSGELKNHIVEFSSFDFTSGNKIIPGMYELDVKAYDCKWDGILPQVMNFFQEPDKEYMARTKVILYSQGALKFNETLESILKKKMEIAEKEKDAQLLFWKDIEQKFQTLEAISLQIEQHLLDFLDGHPASFKKNLKIMVDEYTQKYGSFLTSFVVENEKYFDSLDLKGDSKKRTYEMKVRLTAKNVGLESMKFIEEFQGMKKAPTKKELRALSDRVKNIFSKLKLEISEKLSQVSLDQEKLPEK